MNFNEDSYTVAESVGQASVSLHIDGQFFVPVWAIVEISDGTATGGLCTLIHSLNEQMSYSAHVNPVLEVALTTHAH